MAVVGDLSVLFISYRCKEPLMRTVDALASSEAEIIVVDNASGDGTREALKTWEPRVRAVLHETNRGYAAAVNAGVAAASRRYVLLLNGDAAIAAGELEAVAAAADPAAIIGFAQRFADGRPQLTWGMRPTWWNEWRRRRAEQRFRRGHGRWPTRLLPVDWVGGSCMLFSRELAARVGPWDEGYFLYFEDIDWCLRAQAAGARIYVAPHPVATHLHGYSMRQDAAATACHYRASQLRFWRNWHGPQAAARLRWYLLARLALRQPPDYRAQWAAVRAWKP